MARIDYKTIGQAGCCQLYKWTALPHYPYDLPQSLHMPITHYFLPSFFSYLGCRIPTNYPSAPTPYTSTTVPAPNYSSPSSTTAYLVAVCRRKWK